MALTIVEDARVVTGGVDTHAVRMSPPRSIPSAGCSASGSSRLPRPATPACSAGWAGSGPSCLVGIEGHGQLRRGPGPPRHRGWHPGRRGRPLRPSGPSPAGQVRSARRGQRRPGRPVRPGPRRAEGPRRRGRGDPDADGRQAQRPLGERIQTINQARALVLTGPDDLRTRFARHTAASLVSGLASLRPRPGDVAGYATRIALRELGRRAEFLDAQLERLDELIAPLVAARAPGLLALYGVGPDTAALLLVAAGDHPERLRSEAAWAHLCAVAPLQASSGKVTRYRLNPGGDRQANHALWRIVLTRMSAHPPTLLYVERRTKEGKSKKEIIRCLKRYVAREVYRHLRAAG